MNYSLQIASLLLLATSLCAEEPKGKTDPPKYSTLLGEELSGSGFHFSYKGKNYLGCSLHQFDDKAPSLMSSMDFDGAIKVTGQVYTGDDIQVLKYESKELDALAPLPFDPKIIPAIGEVVYCFHFDEAHKGTITAVAADKREYSIRMEKPFPAAGNSGTPVVSAASGTVVGVMLTADRAQGARTVGFELLLPKKTDEKALESGAKTTPKE